jgi:membrane-associated phospholipid phosphatase
LDVGVFRFINHTLSNPFFDVIMPFASGNRFFFPALAVVGMLLLWKGGKRGRLCLLMIALILGPGDGFICNTIKHAIARPRPFVTMPDTLQPMSRAKRPDARPRAKENPDSAPPANLPNHNSMPSSHAANWFAATMICYVFYRRSWRFMLPLACLVSFSRLYNGVHYPSDVLAGAILGAGYAVAGMWLIETLWRFAGQRWFPLWWEALPSLVNVRPSKPAESAEEEELPPPADETRAATLDTQWLRLGYLFIAISLIGNLLYLASSLAGLSEDEAYQWVWSKHIALSYYSKPPFIAYTQWLGTHLWGDTAFGVRFFSPIISTILGVILLRFFARWVNARAGFFLALIVSATPLLALGSVLMTIDPLSVLFWTAAMITGWEAIQPSGKLSDWLWTGLWLGCGFLSKYTELLQVVCWLIFFILWKPARAQLRKPGPYLALLLNVLLMAPVLIWNQQHHWVTVSHVATNASADKPWIPSWSHLGDFDTFLGVESALLNPIFFVATLWASIAFWRRGRHDPRMIYLFCMGTPLFLGYMLFSFHSPIKPNWIAPSVLPMMCVAMIYWDTRWRLGFRTIKGWLIAGLALGFAVVAFMHEPDLVQPIFGRPLPPKIDPSTRVRGYPEMARVVESARANFLADGKPVFIICSHYGITGHLSFYMPEARTNVTTNPLVYCQTSSTEAKNQFYFWPRYQETHTGENALYVKEVSMPRLKKNWPLLWLKGAPMDDLNRKEPDSKEAPDFLTQEFDSVKELGVFPVYYRNRVFHYIQIFECRNLH